MPEATGTFKVYPRGFLGAQLKERVEQEQRLREDNHGFTAVKVSAFKKSNSVSDYNHEVEALYAAYIKSAPDVTSFEFRRRVLVAAMHAFGSSNFQFWYEAQMQSPVLGDLQARFLDDTLKFLRTGRREMSLETWAAILTIENNDGRLGMSEYACDFFGITSKGQHRYSQNTLLTEVIQLWCSKHNGLEDLLGSLHILFGNT